ncbi:MAG TPA: DUF3455 domain-containing protein [Candidatus Sulfotelmatobacter sp.]|nr:DUF3455 domain-containing protein [Candidatus Sulfotelmatobacter sp.]
MPRVSRAVTALLIVILASQVLASPSAIGQAAAQKPDKGDKEIPYKEEPPDVPDTIVVPPGQEVILYAHATGSQIYTCQPAAEGKFAWTLKAPDAELRDRKDKVIGSHSAGPTWKLKDGSEVTGKAAAKVDSLSGESIPWLLVNAVGHAGKGLLTTVTAIQRVRTHGGMPPGDVCDADQVNAESKSSYSADYYFYAPPKGSEEKK